MEHKDRILQIMTLWPLWPYDRRWMYLLKAAIEEHPFFGIPFAGWDLWAFLYLSPTTWWWKTCYDKVWFATASMKKRIPHSTIYFSLGLYHFICLDHPYMHKIPWSACKSAGAYARPAPVRTLEDHCDGSVKSVKSVDFIQFSSCYILW